MNITIEEKEKAYDGNYKVYTELINRLEDVKEAIKKQNYGIAMDILFKPYPEFQITTSTELRESEDERIRKVLIDGFKRYDDGSLFNGCLVRDILAWLEKQVPVDEDEIVKGIRRGVAISLMNYIDANSKGMCLSNMECEDIENAIVNEDWDKVYGYMKKKLEKQGEQKLLSPQEAMDIAVAKCFDEQKSNDKVEPKFHKDDWIIHHGTENIYQVVAVIDNQYQLKYGDNYTIQNCADVDRCARLWDITKDAEDGDVLHCWIDGYEFILIYKGIKDGYITTYGHLYQNLKLFSEEPTTMFCRTIQGHFTPATQEQSNFLFQKMHEAGYMWDDEKKELKKIKHKPAAWSEEDEYQINTILHGLDLKRELYKKEGNKVEEERYNTQYNWLKSLKDRVQPKQEWKQENTGDLTDFENAMMHIGGSFFGQHAGLDPNDTNAVKEQANLLLGIVPSKEWSEEDENRINRLIAYFEDKESFTAEDDIVYANWLKSLRLRYTWKPSKEQIVALRWVLNNIPYNKHKEEISGLLDQIKNL